MTNIVILGGGNVGTFLSAAICHAGHTVTIVEKDETRRKQIEECGVAYQAGSGEAIKIPAGSEKLKLVSSMSEVGRDVDVLFVATKSYDLTPKLCCDEIAPRLSADAKVVLVQNGFPSPEISEALGNKAVALVVNANFALKPDGTAFTNKAEVELPYGGLQGSTEELEKEIGSLFGSDNPALKFRHDSNITSDIFKKTQIACIGAYCAVEAFMSEHNKSEKFTFGDLKNETVIAQIAGEVAAIADPKKLLSPDELKKRRDANAAIENSLTTDARNGRDLELGIVDNLLAIGAAKGVASPTLQNLSAALRIIQEDRWELKPKHVEAVGELFASPSQAVSASESNSMSATVAGRST